MLALFGHGVMSDLSPLCAQKRTLTKTKKPPEGGSQIQTCGPGRWLTIAEALRPESQLNCYQFLEPDVAIIG